MSMAQGGRRWLELVEEWEAGGRRGPPPPGVEEDPVLKPERVERDYRATKQGYLLRPEVSLCAFFWGLARG